jgi:hypothetical protein
MMAPAALLALALSSLKFRKRENTDLMRARLSAMSCSVSSRRLSSFPDGSPTRVVPPPISAIGRWPVCCSQYIIMIDKR